MKLLSLCVSFTESVVFLLSPGWLGTHAEIASMTNTLCFNFCGGRTRSRMEENTPQSISLQRKINNYRKEIDLHLPQLLISFRTSLLWYVRQ